MYAFVLFTKGLLRDGLFAKILLALRCGEPGAPEIVTALADTGFEFPGQGVYATLEQEGLPPSVPAEDGVKLSTAYKHLLQVLALPLSAHGSIGVMEKQADEICMRFRHMNSANPTKFCSSSSLDSKAVEKAPLSEPGA
uniref:Uncharacterized protein n=1 Tax=Zooxanthella nutricula TaxID=1333877 RepID=A0A7S2M1F1_9DINO